MNSIEKILKELRKSSSSDVLKVQEHFGVLNVNSYGLTTPQMRKIAKEIRQQFREQSESDLKSGSDLHALALQLWKTGIHEAKHIAIFIADPKQVTEKLMEQWIKDFNSWDLVDNCCGTLFDKTPFAFDKAIEWTKRKKEFEKRAGFTMMAELAVHDKISEDKKYEQFFPYIIAGSSDERNFVKKAINWALRQIGKRNERLCKKAIAVAKEIQRKDNAASKWIAADALRELEKYQLEGKIKKIGSRT